MRIATRESQLSHRCTFLIACFFAGLLKTEVSKRRRAEWFQHVALIFAAPKYPKWNYPRETRNLGSSYGLCQAKVKQKLGKRINVSNVPPDALLSPMVAWNHKSPPRCPRCWSAGRWVSQVTRAIALKLAAGQMLAFQRIQLFGEKMLL